MEFLKNLFTNDNSIIGLCGFEDDSEKGATIDRIFPECNYAPPVNLMYQNQKHIENIFHVNVS